MFLEDPLCLKPRYETQRTGRDVRCLRCSPYVYTAHHLEVGVKDVCQHHNVNTSASLPASLNGVYLL